MTPEKVIKLLQSDVPTLMRHAYLSIAGGQGASPNGQAPVATFKVEIDPLGKATGFTTGRSGKNGVVKERKFVRIVKQGGAAKAASALGGDEFNGYYVPMVQTADVANSQSHYVLPVANGSLAVMITSQLTGCVFGVGMNATGDRLVSHVQPNKGLPADQRQADAIASVGSGFASQTGAATQGGGYVESAAIVGLRTGDAWNFFVQSCSVSQATGVRHVNGVSVIGEDGIALP